MSKHCSPPTSKRYMGLGSAASRSRNATQVPTSTNGACTST
eukprot:CAMPEP_0172561706 /NCGR_PEP_ID=MMETSP1067-20121228/93912_1 /TAXON_ID=265564 ORGANISM="Thalassiosira punctigera, Strain Tpunct2005C2" /NCGR_SAMPLE_ID=MMETSP1067 /ASSEMBLY_ACC=CAM_ASM_000444 /LENGTH=40 /DNA_ID= /DNA_START= /DNA_END= /DNA_ORIENTATION=